MARSVCSEPGPACIISPRSALLDGTGTQKLHVYSVLLIPLILRNYVSPAWKSRSSGKLIKCSLLLKHKEKKAKTQNLYDPVMSIKGSCDRAYFSPCSTFSAGRADTSWQGQKQPLLLTPYPTGACTNSEAL